jgi:hypothetical protein
MGGGADAGECHAALKVYRAHSARFARLDPFLEADNENEYDGLRRMNVGDLGPC